ncbi:sulfotransferase family protein [Maricaulis maris]|uniref:sulfotransferase family protein n=1 Tax=Maricaulis maris TaxID=74318 RepID=UPI003B8E1F8D
MTISNIDTGPVYYRHMQFTSGAKVRTSLPNLFGVGPGRSGTSFLYGLLAAHSDVLVSPVKETNFFGVLQEGYRKGGLSLRDYERLFAHPVEREYTYIAEVTPVYLFSQGAISEIKNACGYPKVIVTLRHPIDRAHSQFKHHAEHHKHQTFDQYVEEGLEQLSLNPRRRGHWFAAGTNLRQSLYAGDIAQAWELFGRERVQILMYEELKTNPEAWIKRLADFLELPLEYTEHQAKRYRNASPEGQLDIDPVLHEQLRGLYREDISKLGLMGIDTSLWTL